MSVSDSNVRRYAIYARCATGGLPAIGGHVEAGRALLRSHGVSEGQIAVYQDVDVSGIGPMPADLRRMLDAVARGKVDAIVVRDVARFSRDPDGGVRILLGLDQYGVEVILLPQLGSPALVALPACDQVA
jgi:DNA invertase Pin-like site-specific DNA recombinase